MSIVNFFEGKTIKDVEGKGYSKVFKKKGKLSDGQ